VPLAGAIGHALRRQSLFLRPEKPAAAPSARALVLANGGDQTWLAW
jgi:hypothetical protein